MEIGDYLEAPQEMLHPKVSGEGAMRKNCKRQIGGSFANVL